MIQARSYLLWPMVCLMALVTAGCDTALDPKFYAKRANAKQNENDNDKSTQLANLDTNTDLNIQETPKESPKKTRTRKILGGNNGGETGNTNGNTPPVKSSKGPTKQLNDMSAEELRELIKYDPVAMQKIPFDDKVMVDDELPPGAMYSRKRFTWVSKGARPVHTGKKSLFRKSKGFVKTRRCEFQDAKEKIPLGLEDVVFVHVYLDPKNPPKTVYLGFFSDKWYGAFWGEDLVKMENRKEMGPLPETGKWVRLEIPTKKVGASGSLLNGFSFLQFDGTVYWDTAGVGKRPGSEQVDKIIAAIGKKNTPAAHQALRDLLAGVLKTQKPDENVVDQTLKAISANIKGNKEIENLLLDAVTSPDRFRVVATQGSMTAERLHDKAFAMFQLLSKPQIAEQKEGTSLSEEQRKHLLTKLAERTGEASLSDEKLKEVIDFLRIDNQLGPKWALYLSKAISSQQQALIAEDLSVQSGAALQNMIGLSEGDLSSTAKVLWAKESSAKLLARFSKTTDIRSDPAAFKLAVTMPLPSVRSELGPYLRLVGQTSSPDKLVELGVFDRLNADPALLVLMKPIWHPKKKRGGDAAGDSPPSQWAKAATTLVQSLNRRFSGASSPGDGAPPIKLHPKASAPSHFKLSWPSEDVKEKLPGIDLAPLNVHYIRFENVNPRYIQRVVKHYSKQGKNPFIHQLTGRSGWHVDHYDSGKLRSVDVIISTGKSNGAGVVATQQAVTPQQAAVIRAAAQRERAAAQRAAATQRAAQAAAVQPGAGFRPTVQRAPAQANPNLLALQQRALILTAGIKNIEIQMRQQVSANSPQYRKQNADNLQRSYNSKMAEYKTVQSQINAIQQQNAVVAPAWDIRPGAAAQANPNQLALQQRAQTLTREINRLKDALNNDLAAGNGRPNPQLRNQNIVALQRSYNSKLAEYNTVQLQLRQIAAGGVAAPARGFTPAGVAAQANSDLQVLERRKQKLIAELQIIQNQKPVAGTPEARKFQADNNKRYYNMKMSEYNKVLTQINIIKRQNAAPVRAAPKFAAPAGVAPARVAPPRVASPRGTQSVVIEILIIEIADPSKSG